MLRFALFGFLPITFNPDGTWRADTGFALTNAVADAVARAALMAVCVTERALNIEIPVRMTQLNPDERISA